MPYLSSLTTLALLSAVHGVSTSSEVGSVLTQPGLSSAPVMVLFVVPVMSVSSKISNGSIISERLEATFFLSELEIGSVSNLFSFAASISMSISQAAFPFTVTEFLFATSIPETISAGSCVVH